MAELRWTARWISYGQHPTDDLGVYCFRRKFSLPDVSGSFPIKVSADQRYQLTLNGKRIGEGPQRGDLAHWFFEEYDLAPHLVAGENVLEAVVWSFGRYAPMAQHTHRLAFVLQGSGVSTPNGWKVRRRTDVQFDMLHGEVGPFYIDVGPGEIHTSNLLPSEDDWRNPNVVGHVLERGEFAGDSPWFLLPRTLPAMKLEEWHGSPLIVNRDTNERQVCETLVVHPGERALLDFGELHAGYPRFTFEGQSGTVVTINYGEALFDERGHKGDRNDVRNKRIQGYQDRFILKENGSSEHRFSTLWWRTFRYLQLQSDNPVRLSRIRVEKTGYPYSVESSFKGDDPWIEKIWDAGIRTAKLCAGETYFDCPYYEQLQYAGDTRIQILLHSFLSRDRRLQRNAVEQFSWSLLPSGLTQSRYPSRVQQVIPPFSLFWILMLMDQALYDEVSPSDLVRNRAWASNILANFPDPSGSEPFWFFFDWLDTWPMGVPRNTLLEECTNMLLQAAQAACDLLPMVGRPEQKVRDKWHKSLDSIERSRLENGLLCDPAAEHVEALYGTLCSMFNDRPPTWPQKALEKANADRCTYYFQYYKHIAMRPRDYLAELEPWKEMIRNGLTTFAESPEPTRSDCHAWSAHPVLGLFQFVAGVTSTGPNWSRARIAPEPGRLEEFEALLAHPRGDLSVIWRNGAFEIMSPVSFEFFWKGRSMSCDAGRHKF